MSTTHSQQWIVHLTVAGMMVLASIPPTPSQAAAASGKSGSTPGTAHERSLPAKPKAPGDLTNSPIERQAPPAQASAEERMRSGQMERPKFQSDVSDRLEELHRGAEQPTAERPSAPGR
jgi:hypothetical protein